MSSGANIVIRSKIHGQSDRGAEDDGAEERELLVWSGTRSRKSMVRRAEYMVWAKGEWPNMENGIVLGLVGLS